MNPIAVIVAVLVLYVTAAPGRPQGLETEHIEGDELADDGTSLP
jgi:hypothetical protein